MSLINHPNRREFLQSSTLSAGVAAATLSVALPALGETRTHENRGRIYKSNKGGGIGKTKSAMLKTLNHYQSLGFDGIESVSPGISSTRDLREAVEESGVPVHGVVDNVHWKERLSSPDPNVREVGRAALEQAIKDSFAIGGSSVLLVPGRVTGADENHDHVWKRSIVEIRKVLPVAARLGIHVLIENVWNGFCETPEELRDYVDEIDSPWVGVYFDIGNVRKFGPSEDWIRMLGSRIVKLDVKDWGKENSFCRLGDGDVNWPEVRKALAEINFTGWATREGGEDKSLENTARLMNELLDL